MRRGLASFIPTVIDWTWLRVVVLTSGDWSSYSSQRSSDESVAAFESLQNLKRVEQINAIIFIEGKYYQVYFHFL